MAQKKGYDVLRFIEHGKGSYISSTYVEGVTLFQWLSETPRVKKSDCIAMIHEIAKQLELLHKSKGNPLYQYVNPYCIVISEEKNICLIDMKSESSGERLRKMQSRKIRERFLPAEDPFYQKSSLQTDLFGFGRTLQYMMAAVELSVPLTRREERQLKNVINRCLGKTPKKSYESVSAMRKHLPQVKEETALTLQPDGEKSGWKKMLLMSILAIGLLSASFYGKRYLMQSHAGGKTGNLSLYERSGFVESIYIGNSTPAEEKSRSTEKDKMSVLTKEEETLKTAQEEDLFGQLSKAQSLETLGRYLEAADLYEEILISLESVGEKEMLYEKTALLYLKLGNYDKAYEVLQFGMAELMPSDYLWSVYLNLLTNNEDIPDHQKLQYVNKFLEKNTEYEKEKYKKLLGAASFYKKQEEEKTDQEVEKTDQGEEKTDQGEEKTD